MNTNKPLRRGVDGVCTRSTCECEREGLGDQCVWLKPAEAGPTVPKRKGLGDLIDELVDASVSLELAQRPQSIQLCSFRVERLEEEVRARLDELAALLRDAHEALDARIEDAAELVFERQAAWRGFRADRVEKMVAELDKSRAVAARLRSEIGA